MEAKTLNQKLEGNYTVREALSNSSFDELDEFYNSLEEALSIVSVLSSLDIELTPDVFEDGHINRLAERARLLILRALEIIDSYELEKKPTK